METVVTEGVYQGRFGFYPCDYETYRKLKRLNFLLLKSRIQAAAQERWDRKQPQNRVIRYRVGKMNPVFSERPRPRPLGIKISKNDAAAIEIDYRNARYPKPTAENAHPLRLNHQQIDDLLERAEQEYAAVIEQRRQQ